MFLTMDVGNTNIKIALFEGDQMKKYWRISTNKTYTSDEFGMTINGLFTHAGLDMAARFCLYFCLILHKIL